MAPVTSSESILTNFLFFQKYGQGYFRTSHGRQCLGSRYIPSIARIHSSHPPRPARPSVTHACLIMFRKLRASGSKPAPSAPATTAKSKTVDPSPRAIHISDVKRSPTKLPRKPVSDPQSISIIVANAKGAADYSYLYSVRTQRNMLRVPPAELTRTSQ